MIPKFGGFGLKTVSYDSDALNYIGRVEAAGRTLTTPEKGYINTYIVGLKADGIWAKIYDRGLTCWNNAAANAETFKDINNVTWNGTVVHASGGVASDGTTGYGNTNIVPSTALTANDSHIGVYVLTNTNPAVSTCEIGSRVVTATSSFIIFARQNGSFFLDHYSGTTGRISAGTIDSRGYYFSNRINSADHKGYKNAAQIGTTNTGAAGSLPNIAVFLCALNNAGTANSFSTRPTAMWTLGLSLSGTEIINDNTRTETFMDSMGIGVQ